MSSHSFGPHRPPNPCPSSKLGRTLVSSRRGRGQDGGGAVGGTRSALPSRVGSAAGIGCFRRNQREPGDVSSPRSLAGSADLVPGKAAETVATLAPTKPSRQTLNEGFRGFVRPIDTLSGKNRQRVQRSAGAFCASDTVKRSACRGTHGAL